MREISENIKNLLATDFIETKFTVKLTIPATTTPVVYPETTLYYTNGEGIVVNGQDYQDKIREIGNIRFSLGAAPDNTEVVLENVSRDLGFVLTDTDRVIDGSEIVIDQIFKVNGAWEPVTLFVGQVTDISVDKESIKLSVVSDMSKRGTNVGGKTATQRCILVFKGAECGWTTQQPGNSTFCDHTIDGTDGCKAHGNLHRVGAVPAFTALSEATNGNGYDPPVFTRGGYLDYCVHPDTYILCETTEGKRFWNQAFRLKPDDLIVSMNPFAQIITTKLVNISKGTTTQLYDVVTEKGYSISCSPSHPFISTTQDLHGTPCHKFKVGDSILSLEMDSRDYINDKIKSIEVINYSCNVILLHLEEPIHIFIAGKTREGGILSHNLKPAMDDPLYFQ